MERSTKARREGTLQRRVIQFLKDAPEKPWWLKTHGNRFQRNGVPDLLICWEGRFVAVELKRPDGGGTVSPAQAVQLALISRAQGVGVVVASWVEWVILVESLREKKL